MSKVWKTMWNIQFCGFHNSWNPRARWCPWRESHKTSFPEVKRVSSLKVLWNQSLVSGSCKMQVKIHELYCCCCSVTKSCLTLWDPMDCSMPGFPILHYLLEFAQTHVHWVCDATILCHPLLPLPSVFPRIRARRQSITCKGVCSVNGNICTFLSIINTKKDYDPLLIVRT